MPQTLIWQPCLSAIFVIKHLQRWISNKRSENSVWNCCLQLSGNWWVYMRSAFGPLRVRQDDRPKDWLDSALHGKLLDFCLCIGVPQLCGLMLLVFKLRRPKAKQMEPLNYGDWSVQLFCRYWWSFWEKAVPRHLNFDFMGVWPGSASYMLWLLVILMAEIGCAFFGFSQSLIHWEKKHNCIWFSIGVLWCTCAIEETKLLRTSERGIYPQLTKLQQNYLVPEIGEFETHLIKVCNAPPLKTCLGTTCLLHGPKNLENMFITSPERLKWGRLS
jgi:hypothetical protein